MRTLLLTLAFTLAFTLAAAHVRAQGTVNFATFGGGVNAPITNGITGQRIPAGTTFLAQLYYGAIGAGESQFVSVTNPPTGFAIDGYIVAGTRFTDPAIVHGGGLGYFQIRVWSSLLGGTWESAYANWMSGPPYVGILGKSDVVQVTTSLIGDEPALLLGLRGFQMQPLTLPEPSVIALALLGVPLLLWRRRNQACRPR